MKDRVIIEFIWGGKPIHSETDNHLIPREDEVVYPNHNKPFTVKAIIWDYQLRKVRIHL